LKKAFIAILSFLYLAVASGVEVNIHYCMGEISSVDYGSPVSGLCDKCGMKSRKGCCEDQSKFIKIEDSHQMSQVNLLLQAPALVPAQSFVMAADNYQNQEDVFTQPSTGPPFSPGVAKYIQYCVFRI